MEAVETSTSAFKASKLYVPMTNGLTLNASHRDVSSAAVFHQTLVHCEHGLDVQQRLLHNLLRGAHAVSEESREDLLGMQERQVSTAHPVIGVGEASKELCSTAEKEVSTLADISRMIQQLDDLHLEESSLRAHIVQMKMAGCP
eukprot:scaffold99943_cov39-Prasinocladus_malaysianus.AAC.3